MLDLAALGASDRRGNCPSAEANAFGFDAAAAEGPQSRSIFRSAYCTEADEFTEEFFIFRMGDLDCDEVGG